MSKFSEWCPELEAALAEPFPPEWVKQKKAGKGERSTQISFVSWNRYAERLNDLVGSGWSMGTPLTLHVGDKLVMGLPVTIFGTTRVNFGDEDDSEWEEVLNQQSGEVEDKKTMYGSPATNAFAQAFKRTCALFGVGLYLYNKGAPSTQKPAQRAPEAPKNARDAFSLDDPAGSPTSKAKGRSWRVMLAEDPGYVKWCLEKQTTMSPAQRTALTAALEGEVAGPADVVLLQDEVNKAASVGAIDSDHERRILDTIERGDKDEVRIARDWLSTQMQKKKLGGVAV